MYDTSDFRNGLKIEYQGEPFIVVEFQHVKPGKGNQFTRTKIKNLIFSFSWNAKKCNLKFAKKLVKKACVPSLEHGGG